MLRYQSLLNIFCACVRLYSYPTLVIELLLYGMSCVLFRVRFAARQVCSCIVVLYPFASWLCQVRDVSIENSMLLLQLLLYVTGMCFA